MNAMLISEREKLIEKSDWKISIAIMSSFVILPIQYFILISFNLLETNTGIGIQLLSKVIVGLVFLYALPAVLRRSFNKFIGIFFVMFFIFITYFAIFPENREYMLGIIFPFFFMCLPTLIYTLSIRNFETFKKVMKKSSYIVFIFGLILGILAFAGKVSMGLYSMSLSYYMLLPAIIFIDELLDKVSFKTLVFTILTLLVILSLGSRGPILCILVFAFLKFIRSNAKLSYKRGYGFIFMSGFGTIVLLFLEELVMLLYDFFLKFGINSRTLMLFFYDGVHLSGRESFYESVINEIIYKPILGIGIAGDRRILEGAYVHNFYIEVIGNFGIIIGTLIFIGILLCVIKLLFSKDRLNYNLTIIWLSLGLVHLMVSSSYLIDIKFWIFIGVIIAFLKKEMSGKSSV